MDAKERARHAQEIFNNPLWDVLKEEIPQVYYAKFRKTLDRAMRDRYALAHDLIDDIFGAIEGYAELMKEIEYPLTDEERKAEESRDAT